MKLWHIVAILLGLFGGGNAAIASWNYYQGQPPTTEQKTQIAWQIASALGAWVMARHGNSKPLTKDAGWTSLDALRSLKDVLDKEGIDANTELQAMATKIFQHEMQKNSPTIAPNVTTTLSKQSVKPVVEEVLNEVLDSLAKKQPGAKT